MTLIDLPKGHETYPLPFYLALEEWVAIHLPPTEYFFTWVVEPTVIFGRNQCAHLEVDLEYCRDHNIALCRRRSGGGCVYADKDNLMISYIAPRTDVVTTFADYSGRIASILRRLGVDAEANGRNDVTVDGRKISGNAFYLLPGRSIVHGTLLLDCNAEPLARAITPRRSKLESNRVQSVEARVTTLRRYLPNLTMSRLRDHITRSLATDTYTLSDDEVSQARVIERRYHDLHWTFGRRGLLGSAATQIRRSRRIPGVGSFDLTMQLCDGRIDDIELTGDFFIIGDLDAGIFDKIRGLTPEADSLARALAGTDASEVIAGLDTGSLIRLIMDGELPAHDTGRSTTTPQPATIK